MDLKTLFYILDMEDLESAAWAVHRMWCDDQRPAVITPEDWEELNTAAEGVMQFGALMEDIREREEIEFS